MRFLPVFLLWPMMLVATAELLNSARGPYWIGYNSDPSYAYLLNSLNVAESKKVGHTDHPGTTLQLLGAATLIMTHALDFSEKDNLKVAVLANPELYLTVLNAVMVALNVLLLIVIGQVTYNLTHNVWLSVLLQYSPFLSTTLLVQGLPNVSCEALLLFATSLLLLLLVKMVLSDDISSSAPWYMIGLALVSGFGLATKVTFAPLLIVPLIVLPTLRSRIGFVCLTGLSVVLWTWPILGQYARVYRWLYGILTHTGQFGGGNAGIIDPGLYFMNIHNLFRGNPLFFLLWLLSAGLIVALTCCSATRRRIWHDRAFKALLAVVLAQLASVLMVAKHSADHYLVPALCLSGFALFLMLVYLLRINPANRFNAKTVALAIGFFLLFSGAARFFDVRRVATHNLQVKQEALAVYRKVRSEYHNHLVFSYYRSSSPLFALSFGNGFSNWQHAEALQHIYGEAFFYSVFNGAFYTWTKGKRFSIEAVIAEGYGDKIIFHGQPVFGEKKNQIAVSATGSTIRLQDVLRGQHDTIYVPQSLTKANGETVMLSR